MELQQAFGKLTIVQTFFLEHIGYDSLVVSFFDKRIHALAFVQEASIVQRVKECKTVNVGKEDFLKIGSGHFVISAQELEHILEHTTGSTTCRHEFRNVVPLLLVVVPSLDVGICLFFRRSHDAIPDSCCTL